MELARPLQDRVSEFNNTELIPALAKACDQMVEPNQRVRIERLEIDMGTIPIDKLENELKDGIVKQFKNQLQRMVLENPSLVETIKKTYDTSSSVTSETESIQYKKIDLFLYFLEHGTIPWWYPTKELKMNEVIEELILNSPKLILEKLVPLFISYNIRLRLAETLTDKQFVMLIDPDNQLKLKSIWNELIIQFEKGFFTLHSLRKIKRTVFEKVLSELTFLENISLRHHRLKKAILQSVVSFQPKQIELKANSEKVYVPNVEENMLLLKLVENLSVEELQGMFKELDSLEINQTDKALAKLPKQEDKHLKKRKLSEDIFIEINNAGIVLLWPYLQLFFKELNLIEDNDFIDDISRWKAIHLLHFLAFGNEEAEEHQWALNKILCGLSISDFVPVEHSLSKAEKLECNNLLQSVINNWKILKNTSVHGLQQTFLVRNGLLKNDQQGYIVEIERTSVDVLLDKLSWPISVISLPWNNRLIHVKW